MVDQMEDVMTIILGLGDPEEPGMHGPLKKACPTGDAVELVTKIRDMCDDWLQSAGKEGEEKPDEKPEEPEQPEMPGINDEKE